MIAWFIWNNMRSDAMGLWVENLPPIVRPEERNEKIEIPGRAGSLVMLQGEDVYKSYVKECTVVCRRDIDLQNVLDWLRGSGTVVFGNEPYKAYKGTIVSEVRFEKVSNDLIHAVIPFYVEPFKMNIHPENDVIQSSSDSFTLYNPGDVASSPIVTITRSGSAVNLTMVIGGNSMLLKGVTGTIVVDCGAEIITKNNEMWDGEVTGNFWKIPKGQVTVTKDRDVSVSIQPNWRWV